MSHFRARRIVIAADILRPLPDDPRRSATVANTQWLHALLEWPLSRACALPVEMVTWGDRFDAAGFYRLLGTRPSLESWAAVHYQANLTAQADALLADAFADAIVVGCELPPCVIASLGRAGIPVIDTIGTPLRFLDDILNAWRSTDEEVHRRLRAFEFDDALAWQQAGLVRAKMAWSPSEPLPPDTALVLGQVGTDKALIHRGEHRLLGFGDFTESLFAVAERHRHVYYKPHPYEHAGDASAAVVTRFKSFRRTQANFYGLLAQPNLACVYAISSGGVAEARYFGKQGHWFYEPLYQAGQVGKDAFGAWPPVAVDQEWLTPRFWSHVMEPLTSTRHDETAVLPRRAHRIRRSLNADWGFMAVDAVVADA